MAEICHCGRHLWADNLPRNYAFAKKPYDFRKDFRRDIVGDICFNSCVSFLKNRKKQQIEQTRDAKQKPFAAYSCCKNDNHIQFSGAVKMLRRCFFLE